MSDDRDSPPETEPVPVLKYFLVWGAAIAVIATLAWWWLRDDVTPESPLVLPPPALVEPEPLVRHPIPEPRPDSGEVESPAPSPLADVLPASLPELDRSDEAVLALAQRLIEHPRLAELLIPREMIRRFVVTVDGLGTKTVAQNRLPVLPPEGRFLVEPRGERFVIDPRNYERYGRHVALLDQLDSRLLIEAYVHFYPLFQQAWRELGYPQGFFNDRLIAVIDEILATPEVSAPVWLEQPGVFYLYVDPELEGMTAGQRLLIRLGPDSAEAVKRKLREIRAGLVR